MLTFFQSMASSSTYSDARKEWTAYLQDELAPLIWGHFRQLYLDSQKLVEQLRREKEQEGKSTSSIPPVEEIYTMALAEVPVWNANVIEENTKAIVKKISNLKQLIKIITLSYISVLGSIRLNVADQKPLNAKIPSPDVFIHRVFTMAAEELDSSLMGPPLTREKRYEGLRIVRGCIPRALRALINPDQVLGEYFESVSQLKEYGPKALGGAASSASSSSSSSSLVDEARETGQELGREMDRRDAEAMNERPRERERSERSERRERSEHRSEHRSERRDRSEPRDRSERRERSERERDRERRRHREQPDYDLLPPLPDVERFYRRQTDKEKTVHIPSRMMHYREQLNKDDDKLRQMVVEADDRDDDDGYV